MTDDVLENLNAEPHPENVDGYYHLDSAIKRLNAARRRQWDERNARDREILSLATAIIVRSTPEQRRAALAKHVAEARYPKTLARQLLKTVASVHVSYVAPHVAAILEPERWKELDVC